MSQRIVLIDDEPDMVKAATLLLKAEGYVVTSFTDSEKGLAAVLADPPDLVMSDVRMPKLDGYQVCQKIKAEPKTASIPVLLVSAKNAELDAVVGLQVGADDYIRKPFFERELLARVKTALQRKNPALTANKFKVGPFDVDVDHYTVLVDGKRLELTAKEFELFSYILRREGHVLTRQAISRDVWGHDDPRTSRTIDFHMHQLRKKLGAHGVCIKGLKGVGYRFEID